MGKVKVNATVKINAYGIISDALLNAITAGVYRAYKHNDKPTEDHIADQVHNYVMNELSELLDFGDEND